MELKQIFYNLPFAGIIALFVFTNSVCSKKTDSEKIDTAKILQKSTIKFTKQGEVFFQDKNKNLITGIDAELAENEQKRHTGLMFREKMEMNQGMLFIFPEEEEQGFYMKNTVIPLDIIFVNSKKQIVKIYKNAKPFDTTDLPSVKPCQYVVEVNAGFTDKFGIKEGDFIDWKKE